MILLSALLWRNISNKNKRKAKKYKGKEMIIKQREEKEMVVRFKMCGDDYQFIFKTRYTEPEIIELLEKDTPPPPDDLIYFVWIDVKSTEVENSFVNVFKVLDYLRDNGWDDIIPWYLQIILASPGYQIFIKAIKDFRSFLGNDNSVLIEDQIELVWSILKLLSNCKKNGLLSQEGEEIRKFFCNEWVKQKRLFNIVADIAAMNLL